jgi:hypothetical protein
MGRNAKIYRYKEPELDEKSKLNIAMYKDQLSKNKKDSLLHFTLQSCFSH